MMLEIRVRVSAVLLVRDGFTGRPAARSAVRARLDGFYVKPQYRQGGYFVFVNLTPGAHEIALEGPFFHAETVSVTVPESGYDERVVQLRPAENYPFGGSVTRLNVSVLAKKKPAADICVIVAERSAFEPKIAQDLAEGGSQTAKLYIRGDPEGLRLPAHYLILDGKQSEICTLGAVVNSEGSFLRPLGHDHKRGKALYPCQIHTTDKQGRLSAFFREPSDVELFIESKKLLKSVSLTEGENEFTIEL